jgi:gamma-glutamyltranspeptidase/glutathione hydrolase
MTPRPQPAALHARRLLLAAALALSLAGSFGCEAVKHAPTDPAEGASSAAQSPMAGASSAHPGALATGSSTDATSAAAIGSAAASGSAFPGGADAGARSSASSGGPLPMPAPTAVGPAPNPPIRLALGGSKAASGTAGVVASVERNATRIGVDVLERGGNAIDAAVAVAFALGVSHPQAGSIGGGGFMLVRLASGETVAIDYRETSPAAANADTNKKMLAEGGRGYGSAAVPGVVAGLALAHQRYGSLPWRELVMPAVGLARDGHPLGARQAQVLDWHWKKITDPTFRALFGHAGKALAQRQRLKQPALAKTLELVAERGREGFYAGDVAAKIERAMRSRGGTVTAADLGGYQAVVRPPLRFLYRGFEVHTMPPPSMGGIALTSIMLGLEQARAYEAEPSSALGIHLFAEAARRAYADRRSVGADPAFVDAAVVGPRLARLLDPRYYAERTPAIDRDHATASSQLVPLDQSAPPPEESPETTHFSLVDGLGNAVACTTTLSGAFGAQVIVPETGVILGNALGAFSPSGINAIAPGKRMASSMSPALVLQEGKPVAVLGSPGGDTIPNTVAQVLRNLVDGHLTVDQAVELGRVHQQWLPDQLRVERAKPPLAEALRGLEQRGHKIVRFIPQGDANSIVLDPASGTAYGFADPRQGGVALASKRRSGPEGLRPKAGSSPPSP